MCDPITGQTSRLRLESLTEAHATAMVPVLADRRMYTYIPDTCCPTIEALQSRYRKLESGSPVAEEIWWNFIVFLQDSPVPIGYIQATLNPTQRLAEVAYVLTPSQWGHGYATEALGWLMMEISRRGDIDIVQAEIDERNLASIVVVQRLGFTFVKTIITETSSDSLFERNLQDFLSNNQNSETNRI